MDCDDIKCSNHSGYVESRLLTEKSEGSADGFPEPDGADNGIGGVSSVSDEKDSEDRIVGRDYIDLCGLD